MTENKRTWLLIGGAGYIGSHLALSLHKSGIKVVILDNLSTGLKRRISSEDTFYLGDSRDSKLIVEICDSHEITTIVHLAAKRQARESMAKPIEYWSDNLHSILGLAESLPELRVKNILFSSSCSVYGNAPIVTTDSQLNPVSPYGRTKLVSEQILQDSLSGLSINLGVLRYFNVIGADPMYPLWDETNGALLPAITQKINMNLDFVIHGGDYGTKDGTAVRDYLDVRDLADAHLLVEAYISQNNHDVIVNIGTGKDVSVLEFVEEAIRQQAPHLKINLGPREGGDPESIQSTIDSTMLRLGWIPKYTWQDSIADHFRAIGNS